MNRQASFERPCDIPTVSAEVNPYRLYGMDTWYIRSRRDVSYLKRLAELERFEIAPGVALGWKVDSELLVLGPQTHIPLS